MLNEERVKHMVKLAFYESKGEEEEIEINSCRKGMYINGNTLISILWMTVAYAVVVAFLYKGVLSAVLTTISRKQGMLFLAFVGIAYFALFVFWIIRARFHYKKKYIRAQRHVKKFKTDLAELEKMYEEEISHE